MTLVAVLLAGALLAGVPAWLVGVGAVTVVWPGVGVAAASGAVLFSLAGRWRASGSGEASETVLFRAVAAELRAGSSLRLALGAAAARVPELGLTTAARRAAAGVPAPDVAQALSDRLPRNGRLAAAAFVLSSEMGARAADVFETLALRSAGMDDLVRERRTLTAQARMSALVVAGLPVLLLIGMAVTGKAQALLAAGAVGWAIAAVGGLLELSGVAAVLFMLRRADK